jgi:alpha-galactosidase
VTEFRLDAGTGDGAQTIALTTSGGIPEVIWWGGLLPASEDLGQLAASARNDLTGGMLDALPALSLSPEAGRAFQGQPGLVLSRADGSPLSLAFRFDRAEQAAGSLRLISVAKGLQLIHELTAHATGVIGLRTVLEADALVRLHWLAAPVLPAPQDGDIIDVHGKWTREFHLNRVAWSPGIRLREARTGRSGHEHPPYVLFPGRGATNTEGEVRALHYGWSGGHRMVAEELPDGRRQVQFGHPWGAETQPGMRFETAELLALWSGQGLNGIAATFQRDLRPPAPGALQLLGSHLFRPQPCRSVGHRRPRRRHGR